MYVCVIISVWFIRNLLPNGQKKWNKRWWWYKFWDFRSHFRRIKHAKRRAHTKTQKCVNTIKIMSYAFSVYTRVYMFTELRSEVTRRGGMFYSNFGNFYYFIPYGIFLLFSINHKFYRRFNPFLSERNEGRRAESECATNIMYA